MSNIDPESLIELAKNYIPPDESHLHYSVKQLIQDLKIQTLFILLPLFNVLMDKSAKLFKSQNIQAQAS